MHSADTAACVLILAPIGRDAAAAAELLVRVGLRPRVCKDFAEFASNITADVAAAVLAEEALVGKAITQLCDWVSGQPPCWPRSARACW